MKRCLYCDRPVVARRLCRRHYQQTWKDGALGFFATKSEDKPVKERLLEKCTKMPSGCWEWQAERKKDRFAYGMFWLNNKRVRAHRVSYEVHKGPIPEGISVLHKCDNPPCINPDHLFLGTNGENCQDAGNKNRFPLNDKHHNTKLSIKEVEEIRSNSFTQKVLSDRYGVTQGTISRVRSGKRRSKA